jgi:hypothetical protein
MKKDLNGADSVDEYTVTHSSDAQSAVYFLGVRNHISKSTMNAITVRARELVVLNEEGNEALGTCGCIDYHMADCPLKTRQYSEPEEYDPYEDFGF